MVPLYQVVKSERTTKDERKFVSNSIKIIKHISASFIPNLKRNAEKSVDILNLNETSEKPVKKYEHIYFDNNSDRDDCDFNDSQGNFLIVIVIL